MIPSTPMPIHGPARTRVVASILCAFPAFVAGSCALPTDGAETPPSTAPSTTNASGAGSVAATNVADGPTRTRTDTAMNDARPEPDIDVRARFDAAEVARWMPFDDVIMGGVSSSRMESAAADRGVFSGVVSLENQGGFASVRSTARDWGFTGARGVALRVRGDGRTYKVNARTNDGTDGGSWQGSFTTRRDEWITVRIPFADFVPRLRGRTIDAGPLPPTEIRTLGLLITDKQAGPFRLEVEWIGAWR